MRIDPNCEKPVVHERIPGTLLLETERLRVRYLATEDAPWVLRLLNEPSFIANIADKGVRTLEQAVAYLEGGPMQSCRLHGHGLNRLELRGSGEPIGICGLLKRDQFAEVDLGYALFPEYEGNGYIAESAAALLAQDAAARGPRPCIAIVSPGNARSIRVLERLGFVAGGSVPLEPTGEMVALYRRDPAA